MVAAPPSPPPLEVTAAQAKLVFECRLEISTIEALESRLRGMQAEVCTAAAILEQQAARSAMAPPQKGSVARELARQKREFRILALATEAIKLRIEALRTSLLDKAEADPFLRQFLV